VCETPCEGSCAEEKIASIIIQTKKNPSFNLSSLLTM
jgi:hypothetical protein